ncbi:MAG: mechanosensitive ion channel family protein [Bacteroidetes bacterium]|nr:mechanosensitive ion channel family protein [Bacteroidota bacterium]HET6245988.1 mechanosensitive ion channel family protein [Bacteroidia bacterium]
MTNSFKAYLDKVYFSNTIEDYLWFLLLMALAIIFNKIISKYLSSLLFKLFDRYSEGVDKKKLFNLLYKPLSLLILLIIFYFATVHIQYPAEMDNKVFERLNLRNFFRTTHQLLLLVSLIWIVFRLIDFTEIILLHKAAKTETKQDDQIISFVTEFTKIIAGIFGVFIILGAVFNLDIGTLVAGLGIGGLALALAAKESLENLLASFTIFVDQPFVVGDLVQVGSTIGIVEKVGFRSTRLRTLEKSFLTIPNKKMVDNELDNLSLRTFRRARFSIGLIYSTSEEQITAIVRDIQLFIDEHPNTNQDGIVKFTEFGSSSLDVLVQYFVDTMDWNVFLQVKQEINFNIMGIVKKHGSNFAYPTTTVYLHPSNSI